jgi:NAD(P)-dependent dehydrogenase (short-subunit alcohol dehydrogenase family)
LDPVTRREPDSTPLSHQIQKDIIMEISNSVALVTGANRGIGREFVAELLKRGAAKIYVAARDTASLKELLREGDSRSRSGCRRSGDCSGHHAAGQQCGLRGLRGCDRRPEHGRRPP